MLGFHPPCPLTLLLSLYKGMDSIGGGVLLPKAARLADGLFLAKKDHQLHVGWKAE